MSLDVYLVKKYKKIDLETNESEIINETLYTANITHNMTKMADACGLYDVLWRPYRLDSNWDPKLEKNSDKEYEFESAVTVKAAELIETLEKGLEELENNPEKYKKFNPENGWGTYATLVNFTKKYITACKKYPTSIVETCR